jgi:hypothetical protein
VNVNEETIKESESTKYSSSLIAITAVIRKSWADLHRRAEISARLITI